MRTEKSKAEMQWSKRKAREQGRMHVPGLDNVMSRLDVTTTDVCSQLRLNHRTILQYRRCWNRPDEATRVALAEVLGVSVEELEKREGVGDVEKPMSA